VAHIYADRVKETTTTTGTGSLTLAGAAAGFQTFSVGIGTSNDTHYCISDAATGAWEVTAGTLSGSTTLTRGTLLASSTGSRVSFAAGSKDVFCVLPAAEVMRRTEIQAALDLKAPLASPALTGSPTAPTAATGDNDTSIATTAFVADAVAKQPECIIVALSDETTALTTGDAKATFYMPFAFTLTQFVIGVTTQSSSGSITVDMNEAGTTVLSTKATIDASEDLSTTGTPAVISDASLAQWAKITFDLDAAGTGAKGLKAYLIGTRT